MTLHIELQCILSLAAGIAVLVFPRLLNYIVAGYLILAGITSMVN